MSFETLNSTNDEMFLGAFLLMLSIFIENSTMGGSKEHVLEFPNTIWMLLIHLAISTALSLI